MKSDIGRTVVIGASPIHGKGLFACRAIKAGEIITTWEPRLLTHAEFKALSAAEKHFVTRRGGSKLLLNQEPERFVNHSCTPNSQVMNFCDVALRPIAEGEEITSDYALDNPVGFKQPCTCRAANCSGWIIGKAGFVSYDEEE